MKDTIVDMLLQAHKSKKPIPFISEKHTIDEKSAYRIQEKLISKKSMLEKSTKIAGYKISMTSAETQAIANTDEPAFGTLLPSNLVNSGDSISMSSLFSPLIEPELIFILTEDLSIGANEQEILTKSKLAAGIEIPDARYIDWFPNFTLSDLVCDNTATGLVVLSTPVSPPSHHLLRNIKMNLFHNGVKVAEGNSSAVLGNPTSSIKWLTQKLAKNQKSLKKGMAISSGTFIPPLIAKKGTYSVDYDGIGQVNITLTA
ncbi:2-keto-4-pentenoate hydratase [Bacillus sp. JCM 19041]|uniref:2-keto-4-pentenoate hydratase n=1 Tax=Bacillus sp. JCM 19041 TaxID=1460637 RepID=UPI0006D0E02F